MGGKVFTHSDPKLSTPRMPPAIYEPLCTKYLALLSTLYAHVGTPIPAPAKSSHGDIDILVSVPLASPAPDQASLSTFLSATAASKSGKTISFAVPYPNSADTFVQLDVHICGPADPDFKWSLFHASYGDAWNVLGTAIRPFGLTATDTGLHVRVAEIEDVDRRHSRVFLTADPARTLRFLGLDPELYGRGFASEELLFAFLAAGRFMRRGPFERAGLKANDRKRMAQRELYRRFVEDWIPTWTGGEAEGEGKELTRGQVLDEALDTFGKRAEYAARVESWRVGRRELMEKREDRMRQKADVEYADAWIRFIA